MKTLLIVLSIAFLNMGCATAGRGFFQGMQATGQAIQNQSYQHFAQPVPQYRQINCTSSNYGGYTTYTTCN